MKEINMEEFLNKLTTHTANSTFTPTMQEQMKLDMFLYGASIMKFSATKDGLNLERIDPSTFVMPPMKETTWRKITNRVKRYLKTGEWK